MDIKKEKLMLRKMLKDFRRAMPGEAVLASSRLIAHRLLGAEFYRSSRCLMGYLAFGNEISIDDVLRQALADGKRVAVPRIVSKEEIVAVEIKDMENFVRDGYGIRNAASEAAVIDPRELDLVLVPGLSFTKEGRRLGLGAGYYDRFLPQAVNAVTAGIACGSLLRKEIPCESHDASVEYVVWEDGVEKTLSC